jgi:DNA-binding MarR family transcriptional regulator
MNETPDRTLGYVLIDVARLFRKRFEQRARATELGLTRAQAAVLARLALQEGINQITLAQALELEPISVARLLDRLQSAGLIERRPDPGDRRAWVLYLTPKARPLLARIRKLAAEIRDEAMAGLTPAAREQLMETLLALKANLSSRTADDEETGEPAERA